jgi:hypothetical protein
MMTWWLESSILLKQPIVSPVDVKSSKKPTGSEKGVLCPTSVHTPLTMLLDELESMTSSTTLQARSPTIMSPLGTSVGLEFFTPAQTPSAMSFKPEQSQPPVLSSPALQTEQPKKSKNRKKKKAGSAAIKAEKDNDAFTEQLNQIESLMSSKSNTPPGTKVSVYQSRDNMTDGGNIGTRELNETDTNNSSQSQSQQQGIFASIRDYVTEKKRTLTPAVEQALRDNGVKKVSKDISLESLEKIVYGARHGTDSFSAEKAKAGDGTVIEADAVLSSTDEAT